MPSSNKHTNTLKNKKKKCKSSSSCKEKSKKVKHNVETSYKLCDTCISVKSKNGNLFSKSEESWKDFPYPLPILGRNSGSQTVEVDFGSKCKDRLLYFFASKQKESIHHSKYPLGYKNSANNGLVKLDKNGRATIKLDCPQHYKDKHFFKNCKQGYMSHVHMLLSNNKMDKWLNKLYTQSVLCTIEKKEVKRAVKKNTSLIINALNESEFNKNSVPKSFNLYHKDASNMSPKEIKRSVMTMIGNHPDLFKNLKCDKVDLFDTPIITYCYSNSCKADHHLAMELLRAGFSNVVIYDGGIMDWMNRSK